MLCIFYISVKQILSHVRFLGPHTWMKLTLLGIYISVKQIPSHVRSLGPYTWLKLTLLGIYIIVKLTSRLVISLGPHTWVELMFLGIYIIKHIWKYVRSIRPRISMRLTFINLMIVDAYLRIKLSLKFQVFLPSY